MVQEILRRQLRRPRLRRFCRPRRVADGLGGSGRTGRQRRRHQDEHQRGKEAGRRTFHFLRDASTTTYVCSTAQSAYFVHHSVHFLSFVQTKYIQNGSQLNAFLPFQESNFIENFLVTLKSAKLFKSPKFSVETNAESRARASRSKPFNKRLETSIEQRLESTDRRAFESTHGHATELRGLGEGARLLL